MIVGGSTPRRKAMVLMINSTAPAAAIRWPSMLLLLLIGTRDASPPNGSAALRSTGATAGALDPEATLTDDLKLAGEFPAATRDQWLALVDKVLKGAPFDKKLVTTTADGIAIQPLYTAADVATATDESGFPGTDPLIRGAHAAPRRLGCGAHGIYSAAGAAAGQRCTRSRLTSVMISTLVSA